MLLIDQLIEKSNFNFEVLGVALEKMIHFNVLWSLLQSFRSALILPQPHFSVKLLDMVNNHFILICNHCPNMSYQRLL